MTGPLEGIKVVDLCSVISGPAAMVQLADQGADVIKVEALAGDITRRSRAESQGFSPGFVACNRGKRSISLDLKSEPGREILWRLIESADVIAQNYRPGAVERLGFGYETVKLRNPGIVYLSISGVGATGPYAEKRVYDPIIQALSGLADIQADPLSGRPKMMRTIVADKTTAIYAAQAVTAALVAKGRTGEGQHVQISMLDVMLSYLWPEGMAPFAVVADDTKESRASAHDMIFETSDGFITFGAVSDKEWEGLCIALERPDLVKDSRFATPAARSKNRQERLELVDGLICQRRRDELIAALEANDVPCMPVLRRIEVLEDPQVLHNQAVSTIDQPGLGPTRQARAAARFSATPSHEPRTAPSLGQDTIKVLAEIGFEAEEIQRLLETGTIYAADMSDV